MAGAKGTTRKTTRKTTVKATKKEVEVKPEVVLDPVVEAKNLLLEIEQAEQDIKDEIQRDMVRAEQEHRAILVRNSKIAADKKYMDIHMSKKLIKLADECMRQCKTGIVGGRYKVLIDLMYSFAKEDSDRLSKGSK